MRSMEPLKEVGNGDRKFWERGFRRHNSSLMNWSELILFILLSSGFPELWNIVIFCSRTEKLSNFWTAEVESFAQIRISFEVFLWLWYRMFWLQINNCLLPFMAVLMYFNCFFFRSNHTYCICSTLNTTNKKMLKEVIEGNTGALNHVRAFFIDIRDISIEKLQSAEKNRLSDPVGQMLTEKLSDASLAKSLLFPFSQDSCLLEQKPIYLDIC